MFFGILLSHLVGIMMKMEGCAKRQWGDFVFVWIEYIENERKCVSIEVSVELWVSVLLIEDEKITQKRGKGTNSAAMTDIPTQIAYGGGQKSATPFPRGGTMATI